MNRFLALLLPIAGSFALLGTAASAAPAGFYTATPVTAPAAGKTIVRGLIWNCDGATCGASKDTSRAAIVCAAAVRELGAVSAFRAGEERFDAAALVKCNAKAKPANVQVARSN